MVLGAPRSKGRTGGFRRGGSGSVPGRKVWGGWSAPNTPEAGSCLRGRPGGDGRHQRWRRTQGNFGAPARSGGLGPEGASSSPRRPTRVRGFGRGQLPLGSSVLPGGGAVWQGPPRVESSGDRSPDYGSGTRERAQRRRGGGDCLIKTQNYANSKEEVFGSRPAHLLVSYDLGLGGE